VAGEGPNIPEGQWRLRVHFDLGTEPAVLRSRLSISKLRGSGPSVDYGSEMRPTPLLSQRSSINAVLDVTASKTKYEARQVEYSIFALGVRRESMLEEHTREQIEILLPDLTGTPPRLLERQP
jgi:hypothetical protein